MQTRRPGKVSRPGFPNGSFLGKHAASAALRSQQSLREQIVEPASPHHGMVSGKNRDENGRIEKPGQLESSETAQIPL